MSLRPPSGLTGLSKPVADYIDEIYRAYTSLESTISTIKSKPVAPVTPAIPPATPTQSPILASPPAIQTALGLGINGTSSSLTPHAIVLGNTATTIKSGPLGNSSTVLHGNASGDPAYSSVNLVSDISGVLLPANGGTGISSPNGTYTPTLFNDTNITSSTSFICQWARINNMVIVSGKVTIQPTATTLYTQLGLSLPIGSVFTLSQQCGGAGSSLASAGAPNQSALIGADTTNHRAVIGYNPTSNSAQDMFFVFMYQIV